MDRRTFCSGALAASYLASFAARAAETFPSRPVRIIVPFAAGGGPDVMARLFGTQFGKVLGQPIVVENKVGAGGVLAAQYSAQAAADGYTLLLGANSHLIQKILQPELKFDPINDFTPVTTIGSSPTVLVVAANSPYRKVEDLIAAVKANPGKLNYGSGGIGSAAHIAGATMLSLSGGSAVHVPLKGSVEIPLSILRGDTEFAFAIAGTAIPQVQGGKLRALGVTGSRPLKELPNVPTLHEVMRSDLMVQESWFGLWLPRKTSTEIVNLMFGAISKVLKDQEFRAAFEVAGNSVMQSDSPQADAAFVRAENQKWSEIIKLTGVKPN